MRILLSTGLLLAGYLSSYAVPKDKSIAAYEAAQEKTNSEIEKQIKDQFKKEYDFLNELPSMIYPLGSNVEITVAKGRAQKISGVFEGIVNNAYAKISGRKILLKDLNVADRDRLIYGAYPERLPDYINTKKAEIDRKVDSLVRLGSQRELAKLGYDSTFLSESLQIGDRFYTSDDLGISMMHVIMDVPIKKSNPNARVTVHNLKNKSTDDAQKLTTFAICYLGSQEITANNLDKNAFKEEAWTTISSLIQKSDLGNNPSTSLISKFHITMGDLEKLKCSWDVSLKLKKKSRFIDKKSKEKYVRYIYTCYLKLGSMKKFDNPLAKSNLRIEVIRASSYQKQAEGAQKLYVSQ
ncbi:MAG: hypothetical protein MK193_11220 [Lentisphaeria bacterium]|nr:hypothetical protein [Lentisphaeria bacterium]